MTDQKPTSPPIRTWGVVLYLAILLPTPFLLQLYPSRWLAGLVCLALCVLLAGLVLNVRRREQERQDYVRELEENQKGLHQLLEKRTQKLNSINEVLMDMLNKLDLELEGVGEFQQSLLPTATPEFRGYRFARLYQPCGRASGDYYDFLEITPETLGIVVADVSGHGSRASVVMAITRALMQTYAMAYKSPARVLDRINRMMGRLVPTEEFITMFYCILDRETHELVYASAGQPYALKINSENNEVVSLDQANGVPLKILDEYDYTEERITLNKGDRLFLYTDGLIEAANPKGELFELERLIELSLASRDKSIKQQVKFISRKVVEFTEYDNLNDDFTIMGIELNGDEEGYPGGEQADADEDDEEMTLPPEMAGADSMLDDELDLTEIPEF